VINHVINHDENIIEDILRSVFSSSYGKIPYKDRILPKIILIAIFLQYPTLSRLFNDLNDLFWGGYYS